MTKKATCVQPKPAITEETSIETVEKEVWFSRLN
jgi:hypothetical protein